jgi:hypothetical protein
MLSATCRYVVDGSSAERPELSPNIEETDTHINLHAIHVVKSGIQRAVVFFCDSNVFVPIMYY